MRKASFSNPLTRSNHMARKTGSTSIVWTPEERKKVISTAVDVMAKNPGISLTRSLFVGQEILPKNRQRPITSLSINAEAKFGRDIEAEILRRQKQNVKTPLPQQQPQQQPSKVSGFVQGIDKLTTDMAGMFETLLQRKMMEKATSVYQNVLKEFETLISTPEPDLQLLGMSADDIIRNAPRTMASAKTASKVAPSGKKKYTKRMDQVRGTASAPPPPAPPPPSTTPGEEGFSAGKVGGTPAGGNDMGQSQQPPAG